MDKLTHLIKILHDKTALVCARDDAAMDLYIYDDKKAIDALCQTGSDPEEDWMILDSCGESLGEIWFRNNNFDQKAFDSLQPAAQSAALGIMEFQKDNKKICTYSSFFHDGEIEQIIRKKNCISLLLCSSEISPSDIPDNHFLNSSNRIRGWLHLENISAILVDDMLFHGHLLKTHDSCGLLDFDVTASCVSFFIEWINFPPKTEAQIYNQIDIKTDKISWKKLI